MSFDPSAVLPWEAVAVIGANGEPEPVAARYATAPADEHTAPWTPADWHVTDPALASRHAHRVAEAARERAERVARVQACLARLARGQADGAPAEAPTADRPATHAASARAVPMAGLPAGVELRRLAAAATLTVTPLGAGRFTVTGGKEPHTVDLTADGAALPQCTCGDAHWRPQFVCKHVLAARAASGEVLLAAALSVLRGLATRGAGLAATPVRPATQGADAPSRTSGAPALERAA